MNGNQPIKIDDGCYKNGCKIPNDVLDSHGELIGIEIILDSEGELIELTRI